MLEDPRDTLRLRRSLGILNGIIKEFASIKLPNGIKAMAQVHLFPGVNHCSLRNIDC